MADVLVIEDEEILRKNIRDALRMAGYETTAVRTGEEGLDSAEKNPPDVILLDYRLPGIDGLEVLRELRKRGFGASIIMMTAHGKIDTAVEAMKAGASDFLSKPLDLDELQIAIEREFKHRRLTDQLNYFRERERSQGSIDLIIGHTKPMRALRKFIGRITSTPALASSDPPSVLITGETGTGKDLVARAIHFSGPRRDGPFIHVNCTALPDHLVEAELFGHTKGAFTDARSDKRGLLESADGGTAFLDEIGHMKPELQAKLLNVLERKVVRPVGGTKERNINVHFIAATNRDLESAIEQGDFRQDLFHRLRILTIHLLPLRDRGDDIKLLADHFVQLYAAKFAVDVRGLEDTALAAMRAYDWPGNIRELAHVLESAVIMADEEFIGRDHLNISPATRDRKMDIHLGDDRTISLDFSKPGPTLEQIEYEIMQAALEFAKHNLSKAARILGISRDAIRYRSEKFERSGDADNSSPL